jgi:hypothetical protein
MDGEREEQGKHHHHHHRHHHRDGFFSFFLVRRRARSPLSLSSLLFSPNKTPSLTQIRVTPPPGKRLEHAGIKVRLIGRVELPSDRGGKHEFVSLVRDLSPPGELGAPVRWRECF